MALVGLMLVRNEEDVIEPILRQALRCLDRMIVVEHRSSDATPEILAAMVAEGLAVDVRRHEPVAFTQAEVTTGLLRELARDATVTHAVPLDGDEFLDADPGELRRQLLAEPDLLWSLAQIHYVPTPGDPGPDLDPVRRIGHRVAGRPRRHHKVIVPSRLFAAGLLGPGNHFLKVDGKVQEFKEITTARLAHFPIRSPDQIASKAVIGDWAIELNPGRLEREACHWRDMARLIRRDPSIARERFFEFVREVLDPGSAGLVEDPISPREEDLPRYRLRKGSFLGDLLRFTGDLVGEVATERRTRITAAAPPTGTTSPSDTLITPRVAVRTGRRGTFAASRADLVIGRSLELYGEWAEEELRLLDLWLRPGDVAVDAGANLGTHTVAMARRVGPEGRVLAFEPQRNVFHLLAANLVLNGIENAEPHRLALGEGPGRARIESGGLSLPRNVGAARIGVAGGPTEEIEVVALDSLGLPRLDLLKADVEGMEAAVLAGAGETIRRCRPILFLENNLPERSPALLERVAALGYRAWWHLAPYYSPGNFYRNPVDIFRGVGRPEVNLACFPEGRQPAGEGLIEVTGPDDTWQAAQARSGTGPTAVGSRSSRTGVLRREPAPIEPPPVFCSVADPGTAEALAELVRDVPGVAIAPGPDPEHPETRRVMAGAWQGKASGFLPSEWLPPPGVPPAPTVFVTSWLFGQGSVVPAADSGLRFGTLLVWRRPESHAARYFAQGRFPGSAAAEVERQYRHCFLVALEFCHRQLAQVDFLVRRSLPFVVVDLERQEGPGQLAEVLAGLGLAGSLGREEFWSLIRERFPAWSLQAGPPPDPARRPEEEAVWAEVASRLPELRSRIEAGPSGG